MTQKLPEPGDDPDPGPELKDPELERQRAEQAAERERESRESGQNKFTEQREAQRKEEHEAARIVADVPPPRDGDEDYERDQRTAPPATTAAAPAIHSATPSAPRPPFPPSSTGAAARI